MKFISAIVRGVFQILASILGGVFILISIAFAILALFLYLEDGSLPWVDNTAFDLPLFLNWIDYTGHDSNLFAFALVAVLLIPVLLLLYSGLRLIFGQQVRVTSAYPVLLLSWLAASITLGVISARIIKDNDEVHTEKKFETFIIPDSTQSFILQDGSPYNKKLENSHSRPHFLFEDDIRLPLFREKETFYGKTELEIHSTKDSVVSIYTILESRGESYLEAKNKTNSIEYAIISDTGFCKISSYFTITDPVGWRNERLIFRVFLPEGSTINVSPQLQPCLTYPRGTGSSMENKSFRNQNGHIRSKKTISPSKTTPSPISSVFEPNHILVL